MKTRILPILSFLLVMLYSVSGYCETALEKMVADLSAGNTKRVIEEYLYFDGPRLWVIFAAMVIAVNLVGLASEIGKDLGGAQLGGSVGNTGLAITTGAAGFVAGKVAPGVGKGIKKLGNRMKQDSAGSQQASSSSAGANDFDSKSASATQGADTSANPSSMNALGNTNNANAGGEGATPPTIGEEGDGEGNAATTGDTPNLTNVSTGVGDAALGTVPGVGDGDSSAGVVSTGNRPDMPGRGSSDSSDAIKNNLRSALEGDNSAQSAELASVRQTADTALQEAKNKK